MAVSNPFRTVFRQDPRRLALLAIAVLLVGAIIGAYLLSRPSTSLPATQVKTAVNTRGSAPSPVPGTAVSGDKTASGNQTNNGKSTAAGKGGATTPTSGSSVTTPAGSGSGGTGRTYPLHTNINATTFWVGEEFQNTPDGSQVCSAYDSQWQYHYFHLQTGKLSKNDPDCAGSYYGGCDALLKNLSGNCTDDNSIGSLRTPANGYFPSGLPAIYENPFYLDLPVDDYNPSDKTDTTAYSTRCQVIPWVNDPGYAGHCTDRSFSYMKNRWVKIMAHGQTCYGQIEDAGPADDGNGNGNYDDVNYVFGTNDARPYNTSYDSAGMDVSPALGACLQGKFNQDLNISWQFVDDANVPAGPWKTIITTDPPD